LFDVEGNCEAVGVEFDEESVFVLRVKITSGELSGDKDREKSYRRAFSNLEGDDAAGSLGLAVDELAGDLVFVAGEAAAVFNRLLDIERGGIEAGGLAIEQPVSSAEDENENHRSDEEGLGVNA